MERNDRPQHVEAASIPFRPHISDRIRKMAMDETLRAHLHDFSEALLSLDQRRKYILQALTQYAVSEPQTQTATLH